MLPAYETRVGALRFAAVLAFLLVLPLLLAWVGLPPRADVYSAINERAGPYIFTRHQLFDTHDDIDIAFVGSSVLKMAVDADYVQERMAARFGPGVSVRMFPFVFQGFDLQYAMIRDVLEHRKVKVLVTTFSGQHRLPPGPHVQLHRFLRYGEYADVFGTLPLRDRVVLYGMSVLGAPRQVLSLVRPNIPAAPAGEWRSLAHYEPRHDPACAPAPPVVLSDSTAGEFSLNDATLTPRQRFFAIEIGRLAAAHHVELVIMNIPNPEDFDAPKVWERADWRKFVPGQPRVVGFHPAALFTAGVSPLKFYEDGYHLNADGQACFTRSLTPFLIDRYAAIARTH